MSAFFEKYWQWIAGVFGLVVIARSYKVATDPSIVNAATSSQVPYSHAGGSDSVQGSGAVGVTLPPPSESGINIGAENGSIAQNAIARTATINSGVSNNYLYTNPVTGAQYVIYIHTVWILINQYNWDNDGADDVWAPAYDPNSINDTQTAVPFGDWGYNAGQGSPVGFIVTNCYGGSAWNINGSLGIQTDPPPNWTIPSNCPADGVSWIKLGSPPAGAANKVTDCTNFPLPMSYGGY